ncbi:roadblock/LC7 domain-containing protein [Nocardiopsis sp. CC223A]|uniref:roadblock/LC7 domain-containing protein n=1 Tax=Nocardiopsis sp. CC223A TaxID=3044051 RepID=UPI00278C629D|nr:roadblock/LC7 domain-containing protein [Nocardiopsis sp. CC223A]
MSSPTLQRLAPAPPLDSTAIAALLTRTRASAAVVATLDGLAVAYHGTDQETAEKTAAVFGAAMGFTVQGATALRRGGVDIIIVHLKHGAILAVPITPCSQLLMVVERDRVREASGRAVMVAAALAEHLPDELPRTVGGANLYRLRMSEANR